MSIWRDSRKPDPEKLSKGTVQSKPYLLLALVVMIEEFCTFAVIGPRLVIGRGGLPRPITAASAVCSSYRASKKALINFFFLTL